jgi:heparan-alpha-glucosaminide N-acetyltransferase
MTTASAAATSSPSIGIGGQTAPARIASIDIFRGLTMAVMIFVNELAEVRGLPWWTYHAKASWNVMTYVDMVYPFFLFIVGLAIPLAIRARLKKNPSIPALWWHVLVRSASLIVLGLILANADKVDPRRTGMSGSAWGLIALTAGVLFWNVYPESERHALNFRVLRKTGLVMLVVMYAIFRRTTPSGHVAWIDGSYPEILGLIGYTYLSVTALYLFTRRWLWAPLAWFVALVALCAVSTLHWLNFPNTLPLYCWPFSNGSWACMTMAGVVTSAIFLGEHCWRTARERMLVAVAFAVPVLVAGWLLTPLGISKIRATPTWSLYSIGAAVLCFTLLYWICDVKKRTKWALVVRPAGANTLLTYLLPDFYVFYITVVGWLYFETHFSVGWAGVVKSVVFTFFILGVSALLTRCRLRMQL